MNVHQIESAIRCPCGRSDLYLVVSCFAERNTARSAALLLSTTSRDRGNLDQAEDIPDVQDKFPEKGLESVLAPHTDLATNWGTPYCT